MNGPRTVCPCGGGQNRLSATVALARGTSHTAPLTTLLAMAHALVTVHASFLADEE